MRGVLVLRECGRRGKNLKKNKTVLRGASRQTTNNRTDILQGTNLLSSKVHLEVSAASAGAIKAVEDAGGTVTCVHFNALGEF